MRSNGIFNKAIFFLLALLLWLSPGASAFEQSRDQVLILCYHDIPKQVTDDRYAVSQKSFISQIEYLLAHGYNFVGIDDIIAANKGDKLLPEKAVMLSFDDGYYSFYEFVAPVLELYQIPGLLAIPSLWIDEKPKDVKQKLMDWQQIKEVAQNPFVDIASHTHSLHTAHVYNPQGNTAWAATSRNYDLKTGKYETENEYAERVYDDLVYSKNLLEEKIGSQLKAVVWPYGKFNQTCIELADKAGFQAMLTLNDDAIADIKNVKSLNRYMVEKNPAPGRFVKDLKQLFEHDPRIRALQADIDLIYDDDPVQMEKNLDAFIERVFKMKVTTVYLQAFCDDKATGNIESVYFPNRVLPCKADVFSRIVNQLAIREIQVYAWMPMLSISFPDQQKNKRLRVRQFKNNKISLSDSWYERLSPFSEEAVSALVRLYEDMAKNSKIAGVIFQDDGYLNDFEDFHPAALDDYKKITGQGPTELSQLSAYQQKQWTDLKTDTLIALTERLKKAVVKYQPEARFARTIYAPVLEAPYSEQWFAQNYKKSLKAYDYVVVMAYPYLEEVKHPNAWLKKLVDKAAETSGGLKKTVFKIQSYDWEKGKWIDSKILIKWLRTLISRGAKNAAYYPDDCFADQPRADTIRLMISVEDFPFKRDGKQLNNMY